METPASRLSNPRRVDGSLLNSNREANVMTGHSLHPLAPQSLLPGCSPKSRSHLSVSQNPPEQLGLPSAVTPGANIALSCTTACYRASTLPIRAGPSEAQQHDQTHPTSVDRHPCHSDPVELGVENRKENQAIILDGASGRAGAIDKRWTAPDLWGMADF